MARVMRASEGAGVEWDEGFAVDRRSGKPKRQCLLVPRRSHPSVAEEFLQGLIPKDKGWVTGGSGTGR